MISTDQQTGNAGADHLLGILPHHLKELRTSGLNDETIKAAGIYSETDQAKLALMLNWSGIPKRLGAAIVFPFRKLDGTNGFHRIKPDNPRKSKGKQIKYESPIGHPNGVYFPPGVADRLTSNKSGRVLITEGEKKSLAANQAGFACIGLVGVMGWKPKGKERLLPELEAIEWSGRPVYIAFDSDITEKEQVQDAESRIAAQFKNRGANVRVLRIPDGPSGEDGKPTKMGLDDFLLAHGAVALEKLIENSQEPTAPEGIETKQPANQLDPATEAAAFLSSVKVDGVYKLRYWRGAWWRWVKGRYEEVPNAEVRAAVVEFLNDRCYGLGMNVTSNVIDQLKAIAILSSRTDSPSWLGEPPTGSPPELMLPTKSGIVDLEAMQAGIDDYVIPKTPTYFCTAALEFPYVPDAPTPVQLLKFLDELWPDDRESIETLQEFFGYWLTPDTSQQKILLCVGPKRSGKGTIARVARELVGPGNVCGPTLAGLATNFGLWPLIGKNLGIISDARISGRVDQGIVTERLLTISGEDAVTIDRKHQEPLTCKLPTRLAIFSNELPRLDDSSGALAGRMVVLRMKRSFYGQEDHKLTQKLLEELPGILLWAIEGWKRLRERGYFIQPADGREMLQDMNELSSPVSQFVDECCDVEPGLMIPVSELFEAWQKWSERMGRKNVSTLQVFGRDLLAAIPEISKTHPRSNGRRYRAYEGISLKITERF